jgi:pimeloyl-ACP methyl ester carboxylesterase
MPAPKVLTASASAAGVLAGAIALAAARSRPYATEARPPLPPPLPPGRTVLVPGRGEILVRELPGPATRVRPTVLLLHGWMVTADTNFYPAYAPLGRIARVLSYDHRGHGHGLRPAHPFRLVDAADDAAALLDVLGTGPVIVVGYSLGGAVAQLLWRRRPDLVAGLVLCATSATYAHNAAYRSLWRGMGALQLALRLLPRHLLERGLRAQAAGTIPRVFTRLVHPGTPPAVLDALPWITGEIDRRSPEDVAEAGRELGRHEARDWIGEVDVPTAVLVTSADRLVPPALQRDLAARIPGCRRIEVACDHDGPVGRAELFVPAVVEAVETLAGERARV